MLHGNAKNAIFVNNAENAELPKNLEFKSFKNFEIFSFKNSKYLNSLPKAFKKSSLTIAKG